jgi:hypothetical protein
VGKRETGKGGVEWECLVWLNSHGWWAWHNSTIGLYDKETGRYRSNRNPFSIRGASDIIAIRSHGRVLFVEVKSETGTQSKHQKLFEANLRKRGVHYILVRSVKELEEAVNAIQEKW